jgi:TonB family protein
VRTFGPPEGGAKDSLNVVYDCSYRQQDVQQASEKATTPVATATSATAPVETAPVAPAPAATALVANSAKPSHLYMKQMAERLQQNFRSYELVDANVPAGNSGELWFDVNRDGSLSNVRIGKPSGWNSLDYACVRAVERTTTVGALPEEYKPRTLPATFACTYGGSNASRASLSVESATDKSNLYVGSVRNPNH